MPSFHITYELALYTCQNTCNALHFIFNNLGTIVPAHKEKLVREKKEEGNKAAPVVFSPPTFLNRVSRKEKEREN